MATKKTTARKPKKTVKDNSEINRTYSILIFGLGLLFLAMTYIDGSEMWENIFKGTLFGIFGWGAYLIAPLTIYIALLVAIKEPFKKKLLQGALLILVFCGSAVIFSKNGIIGENFSESLNYLWTTGHNTHFGGVLAIFIALPLLALGKAVAIIMVLVLLIIFTMLFTGITPYDIYKFLGKTANDTKDAAKSNAENIAKKRKERIEAQKELESRNAQEEKIANKKQNKKSVPIDISMNDDVIPSGEYEPSFPDIPTNNGKNIGITTEPEYMKVQEETVTKVTPTPVITTKDIFSVAIDNDPDAPIPQPEVISELLTSDNDESTTNTQNAPQYDTLIKKALDVNDNVATIPTTPAPTPVTSVINSIMGTTPHRLPSITLLDKQAVAKDIDADREMRQNADKLVSTLNSFGVKTRMLDISRGPSVTRYELQPELGVKISKITNLSDDIALNLASVGVRIEAPIPGKPAVGIEVPNKIKSSVSIRSILESKDFQDSESPVTFCLGRDIAGKVQIADLAKMPHLLIAGSTGSGKSVCINSIIISFLYKSLPEDLKMILIDPKVVELAEYNGIPHLLMPVVTEPRKAAGALGSAVAEMEKRYQMFANANVRDIKSYNVFAKGEGLEKLPYIAIIIDELADLMMVSGKEVEDYICRIAQKARAAGMHLIVATQRPSVDVITGLIKANIPSRIAFAVSSQIDSRTILDGAGAEKLLGMGDMLYMPVGAGKPVRIQGNYVKDSEIARVLKDIKIDAVAEYNEEMIATAERMATAEKGNGSTTSTGASTDDNDPMFNKAVECVIDAGMASTSLLQRRLKLGYARAARIMDEMEQAHIIGPYEGSKPRQVLMSKQQFLETTMNNEPENSQPDQMSLL